MTGCPPQDVKALSGSGRSQLISGDPLYTPKSPTLRDRRKVGLTLDTCIGRSSSTSKRKDPLPLSRHAFLQRVTMNSPDQLPLKSMSLKRTLESQTLSSSSESNLSCEAEKQIGMKSGMLQEAETSWLSLPMYEVLNFNQSNVILTSEEFAQILPNLSQWNVRFTYFGEIPVLENPAGLGMRRVSALTLKVPVQNSGMVTKIKKMLLSMSLEETSVILINKASLTCSDGWTDIPFWSRQKDQGSYCLLAESGSRVTSRLPTGILLWMRTLPLLCCED
ncbi:putative Rep protein [Circovirus-like genome DCCV-6]|uniref:putative Rep protein n=1 Tax=Circovirus-like genome DCCV-6 TaxID=1788446 RepID=UPI0007F9FAD8|nr:putative Rep protein [Circovirus-like genome DCCV-6]AMB42967.1 putative Rep protein [Circovirus-like genome DCCV-6]